MLRKENKKPVTRTGSLILAGEQGFEPWLTESESVVLPLDDPPISISKDNALRPGFKPWKNRQPGSESALTELGCATCFAQANLFTFDFTRVAGNKPGSA